MVREQAQAYLINPEERRPVELVCWQRLPAGDEEEAGVLPESGESQFGAAVGIAVVGILDVCAFSKEGIAFV
jgi:hypothetical protein